MDVLQLLQPSSLVLYLLVALRTSAAMAVGPLAAWPGVSFPSRVLLGLGIALALAPSVPTAVPAVQLRLGSTVMIQELALGLFVGTGSTLLVSALQFVAGLIDFQAGFSFGSTVDPMAGRESGPIERFLGAFAAVLFFDLNGHQLFLLSLDNLFQIVPVGGTPRLAGPDSVAHFLTAIVVAALAMALPIVTLLLLLDLALALLSRAAPQFNLFAIGLPARVGAALIVLALLLPVTATQLEYLLGHLPDVLSILVRR
jgi:flagellar biosynthetic protein FliR